MSNLVTRRDLTLALRSEMESILEARPDCIGPRGMPVGNPILMAFRAEQASLDPIGSRTLPGTRRDLLLTGMKELQRGQQGSWIGSRQIRQGLCGQVEVWFRERAGQLGFTFLEGIGPDHPTPWRTWTVQLGSGRNGFSPVRLAGTGLANRVCHDLEGRSGPFWIEIRQVEDVPARLFGWRARARFESERALPDPAETPDPIWIRAESPTRTGLPTYHTVRIECPEPLWILCAGSPPLAHPGGPGVTIWNAVVYPEELEEIQKVIETQGGRCLIDPEHDPVGSLSIPDPI